MNLHRRPLLNNLNETRLLDGEATIQQNYTKLNMRNQKEPHRTFRNHKVLASLFCEKSFHFIFTELLNLELRVSQSLLSA